MPVFSVNGGKAKLWNASETMPPQLAERSADHAHRGRRDRQQPHHVAAADVAIAIRLQQALVLLVATELHHSFLPIFARTVRALHLPRLKRRTTYPPLAQQIQIVSGY